VVRAEVEGNVGQRRHTKIRRSIIKEEEARNRSESAHKSKEMILSPISLFIVYDKWEPGQRLTLLILIYTSAALSLLSCLFILYALTILYKLRANSIRRLVFYMVWADMGAAIMWLIAASLEPSSSSAILSSFSYPASTSATSPFSTSALDTNGTADAGGTVIEWGGIDWGCRLVSPLQVYFCLASIFWATNIGSPLSFTISLFTIFLFFIYLFAPSTATETVWRMGHVTFTPMGEIKRTTPLSSSSSSSSSFDALGPSRSLLSLFSDLTCACGQCPTRVRPTPAPIKFLRGLSRFLSSCSP
jgi:hypothetical protein